MFEIRGDSAITIFYGLKGDVEVATTSAASGSTAQAGTSRDSMGLKRMPPSGLASGSSVRHSQILILQSMN